MLHENCDIIVIIKANDCVICFGYLFIVDEHGGVKGLRRPVNEIGGLAGCHVDHHAL